jgi:hypothetical protein
MYSRRATLRMCVNQQFSSFFCRETNFSTESATLLMKLTLLAFCFNSGKKVSASRSSYSEAGKTKKNIVVVRRCFFLSRGFLSTTAFLPARSTRHNCLLESKMSRSGSEERSESREPDLTPRNAAKHLRRRRGVPLQQRALSPLHDRERMRRRERERRRERNKVGDQERERDEESEGIKKERER